MTMPLPELWRCPKCGAKLVAKNMSHSCGRFTLERLFEKCDPIVYEIFLKFKGMIEAYGPAVMIPQKSRVVFMTRLRFANVVPKKHCLICSLGLVKQHRHPTLIRVDHYSAHFIGHQFRICSPKELDEELSAMIPESYAVGDQVWRENKKRS